MGSRGCLPTRKQTPKIQEPSIIMQKRIGKENWQARGNMSIFRQKKVSSEQEKLEEGKEKLEKLIGEGAVADQRIYHKILQAAAIKQNEWTMLEQRMEQLKTVKKNAMQADVKALKELRPGTSITINGVTRKITEASPGMTLTEEVLLGKKKP